MKRVFGLFVLSVLILGMNLTLAQTKQPFVVKEGKTLVLSELQKQVADKEKNPDKMPGTLICALLFSDSDIAVCTVDINSPRGGTDFLFSYICETMSTWKFSCKANGALYYTINSSGTIIVDTAAPLKADNKTPVLAMELPKFSIKESDYELRNGIDLALIDKEFSPQNIESSIKLVRKGFSAFLYNLGMVYFVIFLLLAIMLIGSALYVWFNARFKIIPHKFPNFYDIVHKLWTHSIFYVTEPINIENTDEKVDVTLDCYSSNLSEEGEILFKIQRLLDTDEIKNRIADLNLEKYCPDVQFDALKKSISAAVLDFKKATDDAQKKEIICRANSFVFKYYSEPFLQMVRSICEQNKKSRAAKILLAGIENHLNNKNNWWTSNEIDRAIIKTAQCELTQMNKGMDWIWTVSSISPMLGLFGTVNGIAASFSAIAGAGGGLAAGSIVSKLAGGINEALYTTIVGLILGIISTLLYYYFKAQLDEHSVEWERIMTDITKRF